MARRVVVTGAGGGLGSALVERLRARGDSVIATDLRGADRLLDVRDAAACEALAAEVRPHVWINNAAILGAGWAVEQPLEEIHAIVEVNLLGVIHGTRAAARVMRQRGRGRILNVASVAAWVAVPGEAVYAATKHAVRAFSIAVHQELRGTGVSVAVLCPDGMWTPMLHDRLDDPAAALSFTGARLLQPDEVAAAALRLLDSRAHLASYPRGRGAQLRLAGIAPTLAGVLHPAFAALGRRRQEAERRRRGRLG